MRAPRLQFDRTAPADLLAEVEHRFSEAGMTLARLPGFNEGSLWQSLEDDDEPLDDDPAPRRPTPAEIDRMDETLRWVAALPPAPNRLRTVVLKRLLRVSRNGNYRWSWRRLGLKLDCSHHTAKAWHAEAMRVIAMKITEMQNPTSHTSQNGAQISLC